MDSTTPAGRSDVPSASDLIVPVLTDLQILVGQVLPAQYGRPTPCPGFDVAALRQHILGWTNYFGFALADPDGTADRPDPATFEAPGDPQQAATVVAEAAERAGRAVKAGIASRPVKLVSASLPGDGALTMVMWETLVHGNDLAVATGQSWRPPADAAQVVLPFAAAMLTDEYRGPGKDFGPEVTVPDDAPALDRLIGFSGRTPGWRPPEKP